MHNTLTAMIVIMTTTTITNVTVTKNNFCQTA